MHQKSITISLIILLALALTACNFNTIYDHIESIENGNWDKDSKVLFDVEIADSLSSYDFYFVVYNATDYRYSNLFVFLSTHFPNGNITRDTIECILANPAGKWFGKGWSNVKETEILLKSNLRFPLKGNYKFIVQQAMRDDELKGINRIGIRLSKSD